MENYLEYIDAYFQRTLDPEEIKRFEQKIAEDKEFADEVAFYLSAKQSLKAEADQEKKEWFKAIAGTTEHQLLILTRMEVQKGFGYTEYLQRQQLLICVFFAWYFSFQNLSRRSKWQIII